MSYISARLNSKRECLRGKLGGAVKEWEKIKMMKIVDEFNEWKMGNDKESVDRVVSAADERLQLCDRSDSFRSL